jgi:hypothetical protein
VITFGIASFEELPTPLLRGAARTVHSEFWFSEKLRLLRCGRIIEKRLETARHPWAVPTDVRTKKKVPTVQRTFTLMSKSALSETYINRG